MINWFPGHMVAASRQISKLLSLVDVVVEVRDARCPLSSTSSALNVPRSVSLVVALNKADLANPNMTSRAVQLLQSEQQRKVLVCSCGGPAKGKGVSHIITACREEGLKKKNTSGGGGPLHVLVVGMPNTGKSSLINSLRGKGQPARQGATPGLTRTIGCFQVGHTKDPMYVIDTPGVLSPALDIDVADGRRLAIAGCVKHTAAPVQQVYEWLLQELRDRGHTDALKMLKEQTAAISDSESVAQHGLALFRQGKLGRITLDIF